jgi:arginine-tRNA-protein transferase
MDCKQMKVEEYEALMNRGWRRSGTYFYKPDLEHSCCKLNTIRLDVGEFRPNSKQTSKLNKLMTYLEGTPNKPCKKQRRAEVKASLDETVPADLRVLCEQAVKSVAAELDIDFSPDLVQISRNDPKRQAKFGAYTFATALKLASLLKKRGQQQPNVQEIAGSLSRLLEAQDHQVTPAGFINFSLDAAIKLHLPEPEVSRPHSYEIGLERDSFTDEKYELYVRYQKAVHNEEKDNPNGFKRFLCSSSLVYKAHDGIELGCFHLTHRIDGRLVAFGVVDVVPGGLSSVYFIYEPEFKSLSLGVVGALKEIEFVRQHMNETFKYYYLGFYIDTCPKMRYKGEYAPSQLLCPVTYRWVPYALCLPTKDTHRFLRLVDCLAEDADHSVEADMDMTSADLGSLVAQCKLSIRGVPMRGSQLSRDMVNRLAPYLMELLGGVGKALFVELTLQI